MPQRARDRYAHHRPESRDRAARGAECELSAAVMPHTGGIAVISQSGAIAAAMAEWGMRHDIGFSAIVSVGDQIDVDVGDLLDFFALDQHTHTIPPYVESVTEGRKFMSAARAASRVKPVVVIKSGRHDEGRRAAATPYRCVGRVR